MNCKSIQERENCFITNKNPTICPSFKKKEVRPSMLGMPTDEITHSGK